MGAITGWLIAALAAAAALRAQPLPGAGGMGAETHGWALLPASARSGVQLFHIPPRGGTGGAGGPGMVPDGAAPMVRVLDRPPEAIAAWENRVFLVFPPEPVRPGEIHRRVLSIRASRTPLGDSWAYQDQRATRLEALPPIPGSGTLVGVVGSPRGPAVLLDSNEGCTLLVLGNDGWARLPLPFSETAPGASRPRLVATDGGPGLVLVGDDPGVWSAKWGPRPRRPAEPPLDPEPLAEAPGQPVDTPKHEATEWPSDDLPRWTWTSVALRGVPDGDGALHWIRGRLLATRWSRGSGLSLWVADAAGTYRLAELKECPAAYAAVPLESNGRLVVMWALREPARRGARPPPGATTIPEQRYHIAEVSVQTGRLLYAAPWTATSPISPKEFRGLVLVLVAVMALVLLFVFRPRSAGPLATLPAGLALAEPSRRIAAAFIDLLPSAFLASQISGVPVSDLFTLTALLGDSGAMMLIGDALGIAWVHTTACEWLFGRSLGKALTGCEVGRALMVRDAADGMLSPGFVRLSLTRAAMRNLVKWGLPPVALFGLGTPDHRHAGDAAAGAVVVVRYVPEPGGEDAPDS